MNNVLILDDDKIICDIFKKRLEQEGFVCLTAGTIEEAWAKTRILKFDALIIDILLSNNERGDTFSKEYKKRCPWIKVIVVTGQESQIEDLDADKIFIKPVDLDELITYLNNTSVARPREVSIESVKLDDRDTMMIMELVNKVVEHTNIVATTQALISENLEELVSTMERNEEKLTYLYKMLKLVDESGILKMYSAISGFIRQALSKIFWAVIILFGMYILKGPIMTFVNEVLKK